MIRRSEAIAATLGYVCRQEPDGSLGSSEGIPDCWSRGETLDDPIVHLKSLDLDMTSGPSFAGGTSGPGG